MWFATLHPRELCVRCGRTGQAHHSVVDKTGMMHWAAVNQYVDYAACRGFVCTSMWINALAFKIEGGDV